MESDSSPLRRGAARLPSTLGATALAVVLAGCAVTPREAPPLPSIAVPAAWSAVDGVERVESIAKPVDDPRAAARYTLRRRISARSWMPMTSISA